MRRLTLPMLLVFLPLVLAACAPDTVSMTEVATPASEPEPDVEPEVPFPLLTLEGSRAAAPNLYVLKGKVENAKVPAIFRLRPESGCPNDKKLHTQTIGVGYTVALDGADLADAFGCAIDVDVDGIMLSPIAVSPSAEAAGASNGLSLDSSVAIASASPEPHPPQMVRFTILADQSMQSAIVDLGGHTYRATLAERTAIFEVPARVWSDAVLSGSIGHVTTTTTTGRLLTIDVKPTVEVTLIGMDGEDGECGE